MRNWDDVVETEGFHMNFSDRDVIERFHKFENEQVASALVRTIDDLYKKIEGLEAELEQARKYDGLSQL